MSAGWSAATGSAQSLKRLVLALLAALLLAVSLSPALAHKGKKDEQQQAQQAQNVSGQAGMGAMPSMMGDQPMGKMMSSEKDRARMSFGERLMDWLGRVHTLIVHFPIAFFPAALFTAIAGRRRPAFAKPVQFLVVAGGVVAPVAAILGWLNGGFTMSDSDPLLAVHRWLGTAIGIGGLGLAVWAWKQPEEDRGIGMILGLAAVTAAIVVQGWFGGALVHGIDHLNW